MRRNRIAFILVAALTSAAGTAFVVIAQADPTASTAAPPQGWDLTRIEQPKVGSIQPISAEAFGAFRRAQGADDALPGKVAGPFGANLDLARRYDNAGGRAWLVPANDAVCLRGSDPYGAGWGCAPSSEAAAGKLMLTFRPTDLDPAKPVRGFGAVPDGVASVTLHTASGTSVIPVVDNVYGFEAVQPESVDFTDSSGQQVTVQVP
jgi:hypothetical protein